MRKTGIAKRLIIPAVIAAFAFLNNYALHAAEQKPEQSAVSSSEKEKANEPQGYKLHSSNSSLKDAKAVVIGENRYFNDKETSDFFEHYVQDGDIVLLEGRERGENLEGFVRLSTDSYTIMKTLAGRDYGVLEQRMDLWNLFHPKLYGIKASKKKVTVEGAEDKEAYSSYLETAAKSRQSEIKEAEKKREKGFVESLSLSIKKSEGSGKVYLLVGSSHISEGDIINELKAKGMKYCAFLPKKDNKTSKKGK